MTDPKIILPEPDREIKPPELKEGITPAEYDGKDFELPEFDPMRKYGMWCMADSPYTAKMFKIMGEFIPIEFEKDVKTIQTKTGKPDVMDPLAQRSTIGWKYTLILRDQMGGQ